MRTTLELRITRAGTEATLEWTDSFTPSTHRMRSMYAVFRQSGNSSYQMLGRTRGRVWIDTSLVADRTYRYFVKSWTGAQTPITETVPFEPFFTASVPVDPFLGPPNPTVGYQLNTINRPPVGPSLLTWTIPDLIIEFEVVAVGPGGINLDIYIKNYEWPLWDAAATYELNQRSQRPLGAARWASLVEGNLNHDPLLDNPGSPVWWVQDNTKFELYVFNEGVWLKLGDSSDPLAPVPWSWVDLKFRVFFSAASGATLTCYVKGSNEGLAVAYSNEFQITIP